MFLYLGRFAPILLGVVTALSSTPAGSQPLDHSPKAAAPLVVEGVVREVFRSAKQGSSDYLLQIEVLRSEGRKPARAAAPLQFPDPGETVYVHVLPSPSQPGRRAPEASRPAIPEERSTVRAFLAPREQGGWEGVSADWFDVIAGDADAADSPAPVDRSAEACLLYTSRCV